MVDTTFVPGTVVTSPWLNDVNATTYRAASGTPGTVNRAQLDKNAERVSVKDFGAVGDGVTDDTTALQAALNRGGYIDFPAGTYITNPLFTVANSVISLTPQTVIKAKTGYGVNDCLLTVGSTSPNVTIHGNKGTLQMLKAEYVSGEQRHCLRLFTADTFTSYDLVHKDSGGDGIYIGGDQFQPSRNIKMFNPISDNNRRQGMSIVNVIGCDVYSPLMQNTIGTPPACGIDIESNPLDGYYLQDINIYSPRTFNNDGGGILFAPASSYAPVSINVTGHTSESDGVGGGVKVAGIVSTVQQYGELNYQDALIINPQGSGIAAGNYTNFGPKATFKNITVLNPYSNPALPNIDQNKCGLIIRSEPADTHGTSYGNLDFDGLVLLDTRTVPVMVIPMYLNNAQGVRAFKDISIKNVTANVWTNASLTPMLFGGGPVENIEVSYSPERVVPIASHTVGVSEVGIVISSAASSTDTLPLAANSIGLSFAFRSTATGNLRVIPNAADIIAGYSPSVGVGIISRQIGSYIRVKATAAGIWQVIEQTGSWGVDVSFGDRYPSSAVPAAPTTGTWAVNDTLKNSAPSLASPITRWVCTAAGTPGTWRAGSWMIFSGATANRPVLLASGAGVQYLDTTLAVAGKLITWNGANWVDATGAIV